MLKKNKAIKILLKPNKKQVILFNKTFGCCRLVYNTMLGERIESYEATKESVSRDPSELKEEFPFLKEVDSLALAREWTNLNTAFNNFLNNIGKVGFPKFKSKRKDKDSYTTMFVNNNIRFEGKYLKLPKVGLVRCVQHRQIPDGWKIKSVTITRRPSGEYYASILYEYYVEEPKQITPSFENSIGIDYMSNGLGMTSDGEVLSEHKYFRESQSKLEKAQRELSRKKKGSKNYEKQKKEVAEIHEKIRNQRLDFLHKLTYRLAETYDMIVVEGINMKNISQYLKLGKSTYDNGYGLFRVLLKYKLEDRGKIYIQLDQFTPTSIVCSNCGAYHKDIVSDMSIREWTCPDCGATHDRDLNAAINILKIGYKIYITKNTAGTVEIYACDREVKSTALSSEGEITQLSLKQEDYHL